MMLKQGVKEQLIVLNTKRKERKERKPLWAIQPVYLQFDRLNARCPLNCEFCNPQNTWYDNKPRSLPLSTVDFICKTLREKKVYPHSVIPWMNSDPMLDLDLPKVAKIIRKHLNSVIYISTNGVSYGNRHLLVNPAFYEVSFTISAPPNNPDLYERVHGKRLLNQALKTLYWFDENKCWNQNTQVRYVLYPPNAFALGDWQKAFSRFQQDIRCLHHSSEQTQSVCLEAENALLEHYRKLQEDYYIRNNFPCNVFGNLSISVDGYVMQCCDLPPSNNLGHVEEIDVLEAYRKRLDRGLDCEGCRSCNQKNPHWRELFEKYVD